jgi:hypothetical protein
MKWGASPSHTKIWYLAGQFQNKVADPRGQSHHVISATKDRAVAPTWMDVSTKFIPISWANNRHRLQCLENSIVTKRFQYRSKQTRMQSRSWSLRFKCDHDHSISEPELRQCFRLACCRLSWGGESPSVPTSVFASNAGTPSLAHLASGLTLSTKVRFRFPMKEQRL